MATTTYGTPYVQSSDLVSGYPSTSNSLATRVDDVSLKGNGVNTQTGTTYTLVLTDGGKTVTTSNASPVTVTIPLASSVNFPTGVYVTILNLGAGTMTVQGAGGVTLNGSGTSCAQYEATTLRKTASDTWVAVKGGLGKASVTATTGSPTVTTVGSQTCYKFTGSGSITIGNAGTCDVLICGSGGGGGNDIGGGGGAGQFLYMTSVYLSGTTHTVTVPAGGAATASGGKAVCGPYIAVGGGAGGTNSTTASAGQAGGSGGGSGWYYTGAVSGATGIGYTGYNGGAGANLGGGAGGGGGGSSSAGATGISGNAAGGNGTANSITGASVTYCAGGNGASDGATPSAAGGANTGNGGGGGGNPSTGTAGGSGIVIVLIG